MVEKIGLFDLRGMPTEQWYKLKMRTLGFKPKPYDLYKNEGGCIICGRYELVFPLSGAITLCRRCFENSLVAKDVFGENVRWNRHIALNIFVENVCDACKRKIRTGEIYYVVYNGRLCTRCCWKRIGGHSCALKVEGEHIFGR